MPHEDKTSRLPGDGTAPAGRTDYSGQPDPQIRGNDAVLRLRKPGGIKRSARELADDDVREFTIERDDNRPLRFQGRLVGFNEVDPEAPRGTSISIFATRRGRFVTSVHQWQRDAKRERERHAAAVHDSAEDALAWLIQDGGGRLGQSSKEAWDMACRVWLPLQGHDVEVVE